MEKNDEKIMIEFTGEDMKKILEYQKLIKFEDKDIQKVIMNAVRYGLCNPMVMIG